MCFGPYRRIPVVVVIGRDEDVLRFQVAVHDISGVAVVYSGADLTHDAGHLDLTIWPVLSASLSSFDPLDLQDHTREPAGLCALLQNRDISSSWSLCTGVCEILPCCRRTIMSNNSPPTMYSTTMSKVTFDSKHSLTAPSFLC